MSKTAIVYALVLALGANGLRAQQQPQPLTHGVTQPTLTAPIDRRPPDYLRNQTSAGGRGIRPQVDMASPKLRANRSSGGDRPQVVMASPKLRANRSSGGDRPQVVMASPKLRANRSSGGDRPQVDAGYGFKMDARRAHRRGHR